MLTLVLVVILVLVATAVATIVNRRSPDVPASPKFGIPQQLDRSDFAEPKTRWLFVLFSSQTCMSCADARDVLGMVNSPTAHVQELQVESTRPLHDRYGIDAVPTLVLADHQGVVQWSCVGAPTPEALADVLVDIEALPPDTDGTAVDIG